MVKLLLFCILAVLCWPLALMVLLLYPLVWLVALPFRLVGVVVGGGFRVIRNVVTLPVRALRTA